MQTKEAVLSRRSVRKYQTKDVPKEIIEDLVLAGRSAPTGLNRQEVKFYVIANDIKKIQSIGAKVMENRAKAGKSGGWMEEYKQKYGVEDVIFYDAPCIIALTADKGKDDRENYWHLMDAGIATGNILTMATNYGLGTVPIGIANFLNQEAVLEGVGADKEKYVSEKPLTSFVKIS